MVLSGSKKSTHMSSIVNQNQGGGNKKAGLPYQIGRESFTSVFLHSTDPVHGNCCTRSQIMKNRFTLFPNQNLPVGFTRGGVKMR